MKKDISEIPAQTIEAMIKYCWPGNVRELQNFIERAVILTLDPSLRAPVSELDPVNTHADVRMPISFIAALEREHILRALKVSKWVVGGTMAPPTSSV